MTLPVNACLSVKDFLAFVESLTKVACPPLVFILLYFLGVFYRLYVGLVQSGKNLRQMGFFNSLEDALGAISLRFALVVGMGNIFL